MAAIKDAVNALIADFSWDGVMALVTVIVEKILGFVAKEEGFEIVTE